MSACGSDPIFIDNMRPFDYAPLSEKEQIEFYNKIKDNGLILFLI